MSGGPNVEADAEMEDALAALGALADFARCVASYVLSSPDYQPHYQPQPYPAIY